MDYLLQIETFKQEIIGLGAKIKHEDTQMTVTREELPYLEADAQQKIGEEVFSFYNKLNGFEFDYELSAGKTLFRGFAHLHSLEEILENNTENRLWVDWYEAADIAEIKTHHIFESITGTDYYITIKFDVDGNYRLFYVAEGAVNHGGSKSLPQIPLTIAQYFQVISAYKFH
ncbi:MAG TPA: hypothetical protein ENJ82_01330, partial [Bacteroidetes bacterium]|nr:hypothetical protein [Bacteroidota bacterium]